MKNRVAALVMAGLLLIYIAIAGDRAVILLASHSVAGIVGGIALAVFPVLMIWLLWRELLFGWRTQQLVTRLDVEGGLPYESGDRLRGLERRAAADETFPKYQAEVEADPHSWRAWFRLGLAYDASGDRRRARWALREAVRLERAEHSARPAPL